MRFRPVFRVATLALAVSGPLPGAANFLYGVTWDDGALYRIDPLSAKTTKVGDTGIKNLADLALGVDGMLYSFTTGREASVYKIDPATGAATRGPALQVDPGTFVFEGAMSWIGGTSYWCSGIGDAGNPTFFKLDVATGAVSNRFQLDEALDINGWVAVGADELLGLDREGKSFVLVDPVAKTFSRVPFLLEPADYGEVGGATLYGGLFYFATGGPDSVVPGDNGLYVLDPNFPFAFDFRGTFSDVAGSGFSGIAAPEPGTLLATVATVAALARRRRKACN